MMRINNKRRGFTLIELLAVIVILAVIALIAVPQILNILNRARLSVAEDTTSGIIKSAENYVTSFMLKNNGGFPDGTLTFECTTDGCILQTELNDYNKENLTKLDFKGTKPTSGTITISNSGKNIIANNLNINGFTCINDGENSTCGDYKDRVVLSEDFDKKGIVGSYEGVLAIVYLDPTDLSKKCNANNIDSTTGIKEGCMKWYAYKDEDGKYTMIADHNITTPVVWTSESNNYNGPKEILEELQKATTVTAKWDSKLVAPTPYTASWTDSIGAHEYTINYGNYGNRARLISAEEVLEIIGKPKQNLNNVKREVFDTNCSDSGKCSIGQNKYAWLFDNTENCTNYGCNVDQSGNRGYWTSSVYAGNDDGAWIIYAWGYNGTANRQSDGYCIRPVITVKKSDLLK